MRHFFHQELGSQPALSRGVLARAPVRALVLRPGSPQGLTASNREALAVAVDLPAITRPADANIFAAPGALKQPKALLGRRRFGWRARQQTFLGQRGRLVLL